MKDWFLFPDPVKISKKLKQNIISEWRKCFLSNENCLELESSMITYSRVFDASGHTKKFTDLVVKDLVNGECFRADKLIISLVFDIIRCFDWFQLFLGKLRVVQTQAILFKKQISDIDGSDIQRPWNWISTSTQNRLKIQILK